MRYIYTFLALLVILGIGAGSTYAIPGDPPGGLFALYFMNLADNPCSGTEVVSGFEKSPNRYLMPTCLDVNDLIRLYLGNTIGSEPGKALAGFKPSGEPIFVPFTSQWTSLSPSGIAYTGGNVGIGTDKPTKMLSVSGSITASGQISAYDPVESNHVVTLGYLNSVILNAGGGSGVQKKIFVTSTTYNGNLGGIAGADDKCMKRAKAGGLTGNWIAAVATPTVNFRDRLGNDWDVLVDLKGNHVDTIDNIWRSYNPYSTTTFPSAYRPKQNLITNEMKTMIHTNSTYFWGTEYNGNAGSNCSNWTSSDGNNWGMRSYLGEYLAYNGTEKCDNPKSLICVNSSTAQSLPGECGGSDGKWMDTEPGAGTLCQAGNTASAVVYKAGGARWEWTCTNATTANCTAYKNQYPGVCGTASGELYSGPPPSWTLCADGSTASAVNGNNPWRWTCKKDYAIDCATKPILPTCSDGIQNQGETAIDCGGPNCAVCPVCSTTVNQCDKGSPVNIDDPTINMWCNTHTLFNNYWDCKSGNVTTSCSGNTGTCYTNMFKPYGSYPTEPWSLCDSRTYDCVAPNTVDLPAYCDKSAPFGGSQIYMRWRCKVPTSQYNNNANLTTMCAILVPSCP